MIVDRKHVDRAVMEVIEGIDSKVRKHGFAGWSRHHTLGVIAEEYHESLDAIRYDHEPDKWHEELVDIAVAALWGLASLQAGRDGMRHLDAADHGGMTCDRCGFETSTVVGCMLPYVRLENALVCSHCARDLNELKAWIRGG